MKKGDDVADDEDDDAVRTSLSQDGVRGNTVHRGIIPQHSVYVALPAYQKGQL
jgi:hypothetical protein